MDFGALAFWGFIVVVGLSIIWSSHLSRREAERTIRLAIEKGLPLDAETVRRLKSGSPEQTPAYFIVAGTILLSIALGLAVFAFIIAPEEPETLLPLLGIAAFIAIPALAVALSGVWLMSRTREAARK
jgi:hypothetical protein